MPTPGTRFRSPMKDRLLAKVEIAAEMYREEPCWRWTAGTDAFGFPVMRRGNRQCLAKRVSYEEFVGEIPEGLRITQRCRNRWCIQPAHLEAVTSGEASRAYRKTHCLRGHEYTPENTAPTQGGRFRRCRECRRVSDRRVYRRRKERARAV